jgi:hypothetical protein
VRLSLPKGWSNLTRIRGSTLSKVRAKASRSLRPKAVEEVADAVAMAGSKVRAGSRGAKEGGGKGYLDGRAGGGETTVSREAEPPKSSVKEVGTSGDEGRETTGEARGNETEGTISGMT